MTELMLDSDRGEQALAMVADDFVLLDRRKLVGTPGEIDKPTWAKIMAWSHSEGEWVSRDREVLAVRGDHLVLTRMLDRHSDGSTREFLAVGHFAGDPVQARRAVMFDPDDLDLAMEELDRLHAEIDDEVPGRIRPD